MAAPNPLRESLASGRFCFIVELVASATTPEARVLEAAADLARVPGVVAGSVSSYRDGAMGRDPVRVGTAVRARGLVPNIHLTCVSRDRAALRSALEDLYALGIENVLALSGDYPKSTAPGSRPPSFDLDSVQLVALINEMRQGGMPFWVSVAVSPFKYTEADCLYQYLKLEKKIAAGADYAITQVGFDARKFRELKRYLDERNMRLPILGSVYVLSAKLAERMSKGDPPGCWVSPELLVKIQQETQAADKGEAARLERAARTVAVLRGLGYAGAYLGGYHRAQDVRFIIRRSEALAGKWEQCAEELTFAPKGGFYLYDSPAPPAKRRELLPRLVEVIARLFPVHKQGILRRIFTAVFRTIDKSRAASRVLEKVELAMKSTMFGCQACGNCVLGMMEYVCPQTCPKGTRNGPCGGTLALDGKCEVVDKPCIWISVYDRAKALDRLSELKIYVPAPDRSLQGTSSWINYFLKRDAQAVGTGPSDTAIGTPGGGQTEIAGSVPVPKAASNSQSSRSSIKIESNQK
jgi:methylenetetrahydrofolate reductase (NADPH)